QCSPVINPVFEDRNLVGYAFELLVPERQQAVFSIRERLGEVSGYGTDNVMGFGRVLHSRRYIDCAAINADGPLGVALLADHDLPAVAPEAEGGQAGELPLIPALLSPDRSKDCVDRSQDFVSSDRLVPVP